MSVDFLGHTLSEFSNVVRNSLKMFLFFPLLPPPKVAEMSLHTRCISWCQEAVCADLAATGWIQSNEDDSREGSKHRWWHTLLSCILLFVLSPRDTQWDERKGCKERQSLDCVVSLLKWRDWVNLPGKNEEIGDHEVRYVSSFSCKEH